ncbi:MAG TPA: DUF2244 domain-containing protein [Geminicoccus sp.]|uniref:DUF2244 domain-containing protein n=1 Tax=Geminicoccus sp. TaxID=2024832 RepID=UPI002C448461|nr:DUF2244 domain-containing protein [Geminicoccus sp.]HWL68487.1 DUF2244 domain-containing protein [Geminicoccus sp.]
MSEHSVAEPVLFNAVIYPNPPISRNGFILVVGGFAVLSGVIGLATFLAGAWPVLGFLGLDVLALALAFSVVRRRARAFEAVHLVRERLTIRRVDHRGRSAEWRLLPYFTRVELDQPAGHLSLVRVRDHTTRVHIGAFLTPRERAELAQALRTALGSAKTLMPL